MTLDKQADHTENFLKGYLIQRWIIKYLPGAHALEYERNREGQALRNLPYDIDWEDYKIDVKSSWNKKPDKQYLFTVETALGQVHLCDLYLCVGLFNDAPQKIWCIPSKTIDFHTNFTPAIVNSRPSKYDKWLVWRSKHLQHEPLHPDCLLSART